MLRTRMRRRSHAAPELDITAFMNLMVALVPFLLITAVFSHISVLELALPQVGATAVEDTDAAVLEIILRRELIEIRSGRGVSPQLLAKTGQSYDFAGMGRMLAQYKASHPQKRDVIILAESDVVYDDIVHAMDFSRALVTRSGQLELFPEVTVGEAPPRAEGGR